MKQNIYNDSKFSNEYDKMRKENKGYNANDLIEIPNFRKILPDVKNKTILDLGCGYGETDKYLKELGASYVLGTDISEHMINIANNENKIAGVEYQILPMEDISTLDKKFDIVISSLAFHYIKDYRKLLKDIYNLLNDEGVLVFSQEHPIATSPIPEPWMQKNHTTINDKWFFMLADYNRNGLREVSWNGQIVYKYHRNFSEVINGLIEAKFKIDQILEPTPTKEIIEKIPKYLHQYDRPYFLFIKVHK